MADRTALRALAKRKGILSSYIDNEGITRFTSDASFAAVLAAMGIDASSEAAAARALTEDEEHSRQPLLEPVIVQRVGRPPGPRRLRLRYRSPASQSGRKVAYRLELEEESGESHIAEGQSRAPEDPDRASLPLPIEIGTGYHAIRLTLDTGAEELTTRSSFVVCPSSCVTAGEVLDEQRHFGIWTHLYSVRSEANWGVGDMGDLRRLVEWARELGAAFVGINPLHAVRNRGTGISPYSPLSRLFRNLVYLDVTQVPELAECPEAQSLIDSPLYGNALARLRTGSHVNYEAVLELKRPILTALHRAFVERHRDRGTERGRAYADFVARNGDQLTDFATFVTLAAHLNPTCGPDWREWPPAYRDPRSTEVVAFQRQHSEAVDEQSYLQFELERQLAGACAAAEPLTLGLYGDLAIGSALSGADPWMFPGLFVQDATVGAPPDDYSLQGQNWGLPPVDPARLKAAAYRYWILLLRSALAHMGALRIDHVMGLFRQYWVPLGLPATEGAYVRYPAEDLLGILALESRRHGALIIGEDLGTVPRGLPAQLQRWGILSSRVLYFEKDTRGAYRPSRRYSRRALVTANTHDHPPLAGFWLGRDLELRRQAGNLRHDTELAEAMDERERERRALVARLRREGCLGDAEPVQPYPDLCRCVYAMLSRTPAPLVGVWFDDLAGETDPVNIPGIGLDRYPSWSRRVATDLDRLRRDARVDTALSGLAERRAPS